MYDVRSQLRRSAVSGRHPSTCSSTSRPAIDRTGMFHAVPLLPTGRPPPPPPPSDRPAGWRQGQGRKGGGGGSGGHWAAAKDNGKSGVIVASVSQVDSQPCRRARHRSGVRCPALLRGYESSHRADAELQPRRASPAPDRNLGGSRWAEGAWLQPDHITPQDASSVPYHTTRRGADRDCREGEGCGVRYCTGMMKLIGYAALRLANKVFSEEAI